jgi:hypothetical protein
MKLQENAGILPAMNTGRLNKVGAMKYITSFGTGVLLILSLTGISAHAQNQSQPAEPGSSNGTPLGDYARHVRKDPNAKSTPKVFDNDNLPRVDKLSVVGTSAAPENSAPETKPEEAAAPASGSAEAKPGADTKGSENPGQVQGDSATRQAAIKQWGDKIDSQQQQVDLMQRELDVLQREYQIRAAAMYGDAGNRLRNSADWDKQDAQYKQQIADKQKALEDAKQKMDDMREDARKAGVPSSVREP